MAGKEYVIDFEMTNGEIKSVKFTVPEGPPGGTGAAGLSFVYWNGEIISSADALIRLSELNYPEGYSPKLGDLVLCANGDVCYIAEFRAVENGDEVPKPGCVLVQTGINLIGPAGPRGDNGEDYVLTEADKAEIAGMVEVPGSGGTGAAGLSFVYWNGEIISSADALIRLSELNYPEGYSPKLGDLVLCANGDVCYIAEFRAVENGDEVPKPGCVLVQTGINLIGPAGPRGDDGKDGTNGQDGYSPVAKVTETSTGAAISITDKDGTTTATITNGKDGKDGQDGTNGVSATHSWDGTTLTITSASGTSSANLKGEKGDPGADGKTPVKGTDYFTAVDIQAVAQQAAGMLEVPEGVGASAWSDLAVTGYTGGTVFGEATPTFVEDTGMFVLMNSIPLAAGHEYVVRWETEVTRATTYNCFCESVNVDGMDVLAIGNTSVLGGTIESDDPFVMMTNLPAEAGVGTMIVALDGATTAQIYYITGSVEVVSPCPARYLANNPYIARFVATVSTNGTISVTSTDNLSEAVSIAKLGERPMRAHLEIENIFHVLDLTLIDEDSLVFTSTSEQGNSILVYGITWGASGVTFEKTLVSGTPSTTELVNSVLAALPTWTGGSY